MSSRSFYTKLSLSLLLCMGGGALSGLVTRNEVNTWYPHLTKSPGTPPDIVFPIVWTILYLFMGIALALLLDAKSRNKNKALLFFAIQLGLNFIWSPIFFHFHQIGLALLDLTFLWIFVALTIREFTKHSRWGTYLLLPYLAWLTYAFYLNLYIWLHN